MTWFELLRRMDDVSIEERLAIEEFHRVGCEWASQLPDSEWTPGAPPKAMEKGFYVAVKTVTGRILTGTLYVFTKGAKMIEIDTRYGKIVQWVPLGEPL